VGAGLSAPFRYRVEAAAAAAVAGLLRVLPRRAALALGSGLGYTWGRVDARHRAIGRDNLRRAFPDWDEARLEGTARRVYAHFGRTLLDILWLDGRPREELLALAEWDGLEHIEAATAAGRGVLAVTAHFGNWEYHGVAHGLRYQPIGVVARPLDNPELDRRLCRFRTRGGNTVIYKRRALQQILHSVRRGGVVAILIDQNVQAEDGIFVDFFGRPAATTTVAAAVALKTGCALIPARALALPGGGYRLVYDAAVPVARTGDHHADIARVTQDLTRRIESWVRETPEQWLWIHRRWKTQPPG
jgi:Kdo2-lipid IVA lauroyltransferase/acyltransferase